MKKQLFRSSICSKYLFCVADTGPGSHDNPEAAPLAHKIHASTKTAHPAEDGHPEDVTTADIGGCSAQSFQSDASPWDEDQGEGVGLSIVTRLCGLLDASLELETSPGKGSTFRVIVSGDRPHSASKGFLTGYNSTLTAIAVFPKPG